MARAYHIVGLTVLALTPLLCAGVHVVDPQGGPGAALLGTASSVVWISTDFELEERT